LFDSESTFTGAQFIARVLEKSGLVGFVDSLKDGRPRLQQAYLNIFNLLFSPFPAVLKSNHDRTSQSPSDVSLAKVRAYFIKTYAQLLPCLCRLAEQGSSAIARAKAVLAVALLCRFHPELTISLCDQRFHSILMKLVEPVVVSAEQFVEEEAGQQVSGGGVFGRLQLAFGAQRVSSSSSIYTGQCLLFLLQVLRELLSGSLLRIGEELEGLAINSEAAGKHGSYNTPTKQGVRAASPTSGTRGTPRGRNSPLVGIRTPDRSSPGGSSAQDERLSAITSRADILKATVSLCSHPSMRRLVVSAAFLASVGRALIAPAFADTSNNSESKQVATEAVLLSLEFLSQVYLHQL
jgi:hypothetical protein